MKNADCAVFVVPVLAMIGWPLLIAATGAVPYEAVSSDIAYWTWESCAAFTVGLGLNTRALLIMIGVGTPFRVIDVITCSSW